MMTHIGHLNIVRNHYVVFVVHFNMIDTVSRGIKKMFTELWRVVSPIKVSLKVHLVVAALWLSEFTIIADNQLIISYCESREWDSNPRPFRYE